MIPENSVTSHRVSKSAKAIIQVLTSDAATGLTLCKGSVTLNNRCCHVKIDKYISEIASPRSTAPQMGMHQEELTLKA
jgi:hypothetical protein